MKAILSALLLYSVFLSFGSAAYANPASTTTESARKPVLIIRFNQPGVQYKQPLAQVVERVQAVKSDASFELVSVVPVFEDRDKNNASREIAEYNAKKVAATMELLNVPASHVRIRYQESDTTLMNEVHLVAY